MTKIVQEILLWLIKIFSNFYSTCLCLLNIWSTKNRWFSCSILSVWFKIMMFCHFNGWQLNTAWSKSSDFHFAYKPFQRGLDRCDIFLEDDRHTDMQKTDASGEALQQTFLQIHEQWKLKREKESATTNFVNINRNSENKMQTTHKRRSSYLVKCFPEQISLYMNPFIQIASNQLNLKQHLLHSWSYRWEDSLTQGVRHLPEKCHADPDLFENGLLLEGYSRPLIDSRV